MIEFEEFEPGIDSSSHGSYDGCAGKDCLHEQWDLSPSTFDIPMFLGFQDSKENLTQTNDAAAHQKTS